MNPDDKRRAETKQPEFSSSTRTLSSNNQAIIMFREGRLL